MTEENTEQVSPESLSDEDLLAAIDGTQTATEVAELEKETAEPVEEPAEEESDETEAEALPTAPPEEGEAPQETETPPEDVENEKLLLRLEELELERKHFESVAGSNAGKVGYLERQLKSLSERVDAAPSPAAAVDDGSLESTVLRRLDDMERKFAAPRSQEADTNAIGMAINAAGLEFQNEILTPEVLADKQLSETENKYVEQVVAELKAAPPDTSHILESGDAEYAKAETRRLLNRAYVKVRRAAIAERRKELDSRTVDQAASLKQKKRAASISQSGGKSAAPKKKAAPDPNTMPIEQLAKLIDRVGNG